MFLLIAVNSPILLNADDSLELPAGAKVVKTEPYSDDNANFFVVCVYRTDDSGYMVIKKLLGRKPGTEIVYILPVPRPDKYTHYLSAPDCLFDGTLMEKIFVEARIQTDGTHFRTKVINAWQIDLENIAINKIDETRVKCLSALE